MSPPTLPAKLAPRHRDSLSDSSSASRLRLGTRESKLALWQANWVKSELLRHWSGLHVELVPIKTTGDKLLNTSLSKIGGKGLFIKEIENELMAKEIDLAVHSVKDLPFALPQGLVLSVIPPREDPRDVLISSGSLRLAELPSGARVASSSSRRICQLKRLRADLSYVPVRGNVDTRLRKLAKGEYEALVLAKAGLVRLGEASLITEHLEIIPSAGQGAMGIEIRDDDRSTERFVSVLNDEPSHFCVRIERIFLEVVGAGCLVPVGCHARFEGRKVALAAFVSDPEGDRFIVRRRQVEADDAMDEIREMADEILLAGGKKILRELEAGN